MKPKIIVNTILIILLICFSTTPTIARIFDRIIAYVNDDVITKRRLDLLVKQHAFELQQLYQYNEKEAIQEAEKQRSTLLDRLIRQMLLLEAALTLKVQVTDAEIVEQIEKFKTQYQIPSDDDFKKLLNRDGLTLVAFREQIQRNLMTEKLVMGRILPRLQVRDSDVQKFFEENRDQLPTKADRVHLRHIFIAFNPTEEDKKNAIDEVNNALEEIKVDKTQFESVARRIAEKHNLNSQDGYLIETTPAELLSYPDLFLTVLAKLNEGDISEPIESTEGIYVFTIESRSEEIISFRRLVVPFIFSEEAKMAAKSKGTDIIKKLETGEQFDAIAKEHSDDLGTREKGGDLGELSVTELNPKTKEIIDKLEIGNYSEPYQTNLGLHIYKLEDRKIPELSQQEKQQIVGILRQQMFEKEWTAYTDSLLENAYVKIKPDVDIKPETKSDETSTPETNEK